MDKRRTQRILGILVIIALVIILFPLLFSKNEVTTQTVSVNAPAFPDQLNSPTTTTVVNNVSQDTVNTTPITQPLSVDEAVSDTNVPGTSSMNQSQDIKQPLELNDASADEANSAKNADQAKNDIQQNAQAVTLSTEEENITPVIQDSIVNKKSIKSSKVKAKSHYKPTHNDVAKLNKPAWVVQMGSFKNKGNARSLTDKLRAAGFNAFTKDVKSTQGSLRTRVYVGPEFKEAAATKTSQKIQHDMNLQSIVLPYKPLAL